MRVIKCDRCGDIVEQAKYIRDFEYDIGAELCDKCYEKQAKANEEYDTFYKQTAEVLKRSLKNKEDELIEKYFKKEEEHICENQLN